MDKSPEAFRTISEVAELLDLPQHVLRFWETRFSQIKPMKRGGGRRYYRPHDIDLLQGIKFLLYDHGYTIRGVQRLLKEKGIHTIVALGKGEIKGVETLTAPIEDPLEQEKKQARGLFSFMKNEADLLIGAVHNRQNKDNKTLLQEALFELMECKRLLDRAR
ncbi:MerR family transcriptional regulator [Bartonella sp. DGB2]|uniref:MerR family transcriptional regulator n=1 Tax=Bartonella sp. DGB2 TaxID=3388426 RepID=UPI003990302D